MDDLRQAIDAIPFDELRELTGEQLRDRVFSIAANPLEAPDDPHRLARSCLEKAHNHPDGWTLKYHRGEWFEWDGAAYHETSGDEIDTCLTRSIKQDFDRGNGVPGKVTKTVVGNARGALKSLIHIPGSRDLPYWEDGPADRILAAPNGLFELPDLIHRGPPTPKFFSTFALDYAIDVHAPAPVTWLGFLEQVLDPESIDTLQEWFGLCLTPDTRYQKILALIGQTRSGKGTTGRVLEGLIGKSNVASKTTASFRERFGLENVLGKQVLLIPDARLRGPTDTVTERLLSISGEDSLPIDRKFKPTLTSKLGARIVLCSNELPKFDDASGAIASRFLLLRFGKSFLGKEDLTLTDRCLAERPGILLWSLEGLKRLRERGKFIQPESGKADLMDLRDLGSTVHAFVREAWREGATQSEVYPSYLEWCDRTGQRHPLAQSTFRRDLGAAYPEKVKEIEQATLLATVLPLLGPRGLTTVEILSLQPTLASTVQELGNKLSEINGRGVLYRTVKGRGVWKAERIPPQEGH